MKMLHFVASGLGFTKLPRVTDPRSKQGVQAHPLLVGMMLAWGLKAAGIHARIRAGISFMILVWIQTRVLIRVRRGGNGHNDNVLVFHGWLSFGWLGAINRIAHRWIISLRKTHSVLQPAFIRIENEIPIIR